MGIGMRNFLRSERGYVLVLTLIFMPLFVGIGLLVIDIGRGNNAQQDHQAAADALALAGARELDGTGDSVTRAKAAMAKISNTISFVSLDPSSGVQTAVYPPPANAAANNLPIFNVIFLKAIPTSDDDPITQTFATNNVAANGTEAKYVYVFSRSDSLLSFFFNPFDYLSTGTATREDFPVGAVAVATLNQSTCDLAPIFMCNPFPAQGGKTPKQRLLEAYANGSLYGRMVKLTTNQPGALPGPGNIGFLRTQNGNGAQALAEALAGQPYPECVTLTPTVDTQPGTVTSAGVGFNTRFDIHANNFGGQFSSSGDFPPALNVRKSWLANGGGGGCVTNPKSPADYFDGPVFSDNVNPGTDVGTGFEDVMRSGAWNLAIPVTVDVKTGPNKTETITYPSYWQRMYSGFANIKISAATTEADLTATDKARLKAMIQTDPSGSASRYLPSRYDVYNYELTHDTSGNVVSNPAQSLAAVASSGGEKGLPQCYSPAPTTQPLIDRRTMFVAVVDCQSNEIKGASETVPVDALAKVFLINPLDTSGNKPGSQSVDFEIITVTQGSNGGAEEFIREDAVLVR